MEVASALSLGALAVVAVLGAFLFLWGLYEWSPKRKLSRRKNVDWLPLLLGSVLVVVCLVYLFLLLDPAIITVINQAFGLGIPQVAPRGEPTNVPAVPSSATVTLTLTPIVTYTSTATPTLPPTPEAKTSAELLDDYYQCINNADQPWKLDTCWGYLSDGLHAVSTSEPAYIDDWSNVRIRYKLFDCGGNQVGVKEILYRRDDRSYTGQIIMGLTYLKYEVTKTNNRWMIESGIRSDMSLENACVLKFSRWAPESTPVPSSP